MKQQQFPRMKFDNVAINAIISVGRQNYIKAGHSHCVSCKTGKDAIFNLNTEVEVRGHARCCDV
jgi:hypothetical protein